MDCEQARKILPEYLDGVLSPDQRSVLETHLGDCEPCARELASFRAYLQAMHELPRMPAPEGFVDAVNRKLDRPSVWRTWISERLSPLFRGTPLRVAGLVTSVLVVVLVYQRMLPHRQPTQVVPIQSHQVERKSTGEGALPAAPPPVTPSPAPAHQTPSPGSASFADKGSKPSPETHAHVPAESDRPLELVVVLSGAKGDGGRPMTAKPPAPTENGSPDILARSGGSAGTARPEREAPASLPQRSPSSHGPDRETAGASSPMISLEESAKSASSPPVAPQARPSVRAERSSSSGEALSKQDGAPRRDNRLSDTGEVDSARFTGEPRHRPVGIDPAVASLRTLLKPLSGTIVNVERTGEPPSLATVTLLIPARSYPQFLRDVETLGMIRSGRVATLPSGRTDPLTVRVILVSP